MVGPDPAGAPAPWGGVALVGTTASGKSAVAEAAARRLGDLELLAMDAMSVYRGLDLATAKASDELRAVVPHHLVDLAEPSEEFTVSRFQQAARRALDGVAGRGNRALLVGGTGLYLRAVVDDLRFPGRWPEVAQRLRAEADQPGGTARLFERLRGVDPIAAARTTAGNQRRIVRALEVTEGSGRPFSSFGPGLESYPPTRFTMIGLPFDPDRVDRRIAERFDRWLDEGLVDEVRRLAERPAGLSRTARQALGYRELLAHVEDGAPLSACVDEAVRRTRRFARRQWAWFRRDPRIRWLGPDEDPVTVVIGALGGERTAARRQLRDSVHVDV
jgi:tRNA dimethylallyltransferase